MANLNKVMLIGNVTRDPELRYIGSGTAVLDLGLAVNRRIKNQTGEFKEEVTFVTVTIWGKTAENCAEYLSKGRPVFIEGRLRNDNWEDKKTGEKRSKLAIVAENVQFLGQRGERTERGERGTEPTERPARGQQAPPHEETELSDDDIPF